MDVFIIVYLVRAANDSQTQRALPLHDKKKLWSSVAYLYINKSALVDNERMKEKKGKNKSQLKG